MPEQGQRLTTSQKLAQKQTITHKLIQSINLMAMPLPELQEAIREEVEKNPALEIVREAGEVDTPPKAKMRIRKTAQTNMISLAIVPIQATRPYPQATPTASGYSSRELSPVKKHCTTF